MTKVDLQNRKNRREALAVLAKGTVLSLFAGAGYVAGKNHRTESGDYVPVPAVMIVMRDGVKISEGQGQVVSTTAIAKQCREYGVKYRMYNVNDNLFQEEGWAKKMHQDGAEFGYPCIVIVDRDGRGSCQIIPDSIEEALKLVESKFNV